MHRLSRRDWIDWFGALERGQTVRLDPPPSGDRPESWPPESWPTDSWRLESVDFAPFDDLIEIVLEDRGGHRSRLLLDEPEEVWVEKRAGSGTEWELSITSGAKAIRLTSCPSRITATLPAGKLQLNEGPRGETGGVETRATEVLGDPGGVVQHQVEEL